jgi:heptosyltransferase-2
MNQSSSHTPPSPVEEDARPVLIVPYMWIGDFVRCHTVVKLLNARFPGRPVDLLTTSLCAPLLDYMPGVRKGVVCDLPRKRLAWSQHRALAARLRAEGYGQVLVMPRTWKAALAPFLAGIATRTGFVGEARFGLVNDRRWGERRLPRMVDRCAMLALPAGARQPRDWPLPELTAPPSEVLAWRRRMGLPPGPVVAFAPGAVGPSKRWPAAAYGDVAKRLGEDGIGVWVLGGPNEKALADEIRSAGGSRVHDLTGEDLRNAILAFAAADVALSNDSGLLHVAAALGKPAVGIFGPTSPWHWAPLNPLADIIEMTGDLPCRPCHKPVCRLGHHRCMREIAPASVLDSLQRALASSYRAASR